MNTKGTRFLFFLTAASLFAVLAFSVIQKESSSPDVNLPGEDSLLVTQVVKELQTEVPDWVKNDDAPGVAVEVVDVSKTLWQGVYGHTIRGGDKPITPETLFSIQSMSKSFTALGVLMAVQDGLLDLDEPVTTYLPGFTVNSRYEEHPEQKMTLRHLLAHRAGFTHEAPLGGNYDSNPLTFEDHIQSISATWLRYPVGYRYSYSNLGIDLAGYILQVTSGQPFWKYIQEKVLNPIGMENSSFDMDVIRKSENRASGHVAQNRVVEGGIPLEIPMIPAGGLYTNIQDMAKFLQFHINKGKVNGKQLLREDLLKEMHSVAFPEKHQRSGYGLGMAKTVISKTYFLSHGGGGYGFITFMAIYPEIGLGVISLTNSEGTRIIGARIQAVINQFIEKELGPTEPQPEQLSSENLTPLNPADERVRKITGVYHPNLKIGLKGSEFGITLMRDFHPLQMYLDKEELVGKFDSFREVRFKPPLIDRPGTIVISNKQWGSCTYHDFHMHSGLDDKPGPDRPQWKKHLGSYQAFLWGRIHSQTFNVSLKNGYLTLNLLRCHEHEDLPGLFFTIEGEALDFRGEIPTFRNIRLVKTNRPTPENES